jgi:hypothetical protein
MLQIASMEHERFKFKNVANAVEMAASTLHNAANSKENGQNRKSPKKTKRKQKYIPQQFQTIDIYI